MTQLGRQFDALPDIAGSTAMQLKISRKVKIKQVLLAIIFVVVATSSASKAHSWNQTIGGFYLGMTNAQVAKIGLRDCKQKYSYSDITCVPVLPALPGETEATIVFEEKARRAIEMPVQLFNKVGTKNAASGRIVAQP